MNSRKFLWLCLIFLVVLISACKATPEATPTAVSTDAKAIRTAAAETAQARLDAIPSPTSMPPTPNAAEWTQTAEAQFTATPDPAKPTAATLTPTAQGAQASPTAPPPSGADNATYVKDINIPDNTVIGRGQSFTKTWQFLNSGTSKWSTNYELVWVSGDQIGGPASVKIPIEIPAGQLADISVDMVAPQNNGTYKGFWRMRNPNGTYFGDAVYVQIVVGDASADPNPGGAVSALFVNADSTDFSGSCPHKFVISAGFSLSEAASVTYQLEGGGLNFSLPAARTENFNVGSYTLTYEIEASQSGQGWVRLHVTAPNNALSDQVTLNLTCQ